MTDTKTLTPHVQGKIIQTDYDWILEQSGQCWYCLTDAQVQMILSVVDYFGWATRWYSSTGTVDKQTILDLQGGLVEALMNGCCDDDGLQSRYTEQGHYQTSSDGGVTWVDAPDGDPRRGYPQFPDFLPPDTESADCTHADSIVVLIRDQITAHLSDGMTAGEILAAIIGLLTGIMGALLTNPIGIAIIAILGGIAAFIAATGIPALNAALTSDVYARLRCNIKDNINPDGSFDQGDVDAIYDRIGIEETGLAALYLRGVIAAMGITGLTNAARAGFGAADANCDDCDCLAPCVDSWIVFFGTPVAMSGCNIEASSAVDGSFNTVSLDYDGTHGCILDAAGFTSGAPTVTWQWYLADGSGPFSSSLGPPIGLALSNLVVIGSGGSGAYTVSTDWSPI